MELKQEYVDPCYSVSRTHLLRVFYALLPKEKTLSTINHAYKI